MNPSLTPRLNRLESNIVIDGAMEIWPEGTSRNFTSGTNGYGSALFKHFNANTGITTTNSRQSAAPSNTNLIYSNRISKTVSGSMAANTVVNYAHYVEGYNIDRILNNEFSIIFWVRSTVASTRSIALQPSTNSHSYVQQYTINSANTWELKAIRFPALNTCPATLNRENGIGLTVIFSIITGTTYQTSSLDQWLTGDKIAGTTDDTTWLTGTTHSFDLAGVMIFPGDWSALEDDSSAYEFIRAGKDFQDELSKTFRYIERARFHVVASGVSSVVNNYSYKARKRAVPTVTTITNPSGHSAFSAQEDGAASSVSAGGGSGLAEIQFDSRF